MSSETNQIGDVENDDEAALQHRPRTATVLGLLTLTSLTFSYLGAYAVAGALVQSEVLKPWPADADPRPRWLAIGFGVLLASFVCLAATVRYLSKRQLARIDQMADDAGS